MTNTFLRNILRCPDCRSPGLYLENGTNETVCSNCQANFPLFRGFPVLIRHDNKIFPLDAYIDSEQSIARTRKSKLASLVPSISVNLANIHCLTRFGERFIGKNDIKLLVVGGGTQRIWLNNQFAAFPNISLVYCDIDTSALVDYYCDAHELPFIDSCFDGVITTAVLEHVLYPERVAEEIGRILKLGGILYSEIPFMQQVHEGAYDFTRYTLSGHKRLFNHFDEIESGMVAGPATALVWAIENFILAFFSGQKLRLIMKGMVRITTFWIKYFDYLLRNKLGALDGASCTYFFGQKQAQKIPDDEIIARYVGAKNVRHI